MELVQAVFDKNGPAGEQWGVALKLKEPFPVEKGGTVMTGHIAISLGSEAEMQGWVERALAHAGEVQDGEDRSTQERRTSQR